MLKRLLVSVFSFVVLAGAQVNIVLTPPKTIAPVFLMKQDVVSFPITNFVNPATPISLPHDPAIDTLVTVSLKGDTLLDQVSIKYTGVAITVTIDPSAQALASQVVVSYTYLPVSVGGAAAK